MRERTTMTKTITITVEDCETTEDIVLALQEVKRLVAEGYTSGYHPRWDLEEVTENSNVLK